jgi:hypothetical protein
LSATLDLILISVLNAALLYTLALIAESFVRQVYGLASTPPNNAQVISLLSPLVNTYDSGNMLVAVLISAGMQTVFTVIWLFLIHLVATTFMGGDGTFPRLTRQMLYYTLLANLALVGLGTLIFIVLASQPDGALFALIFGALVLVGVLGWLIGRAYRFDFVRGLIVLLMSLVGYALVALIVGVVANLFFSEAIADLLGT